MSQQTFEIQGQICALEDLADRLAEIKDELRQLGLKDNRIDNYIVPALNDLVEGENRNPYNTSIYDIIRSLETQTVDFEAFSAAAQEYGLTADPELFSDFQSRSMDLDAYLDMTKNGEA